MERKLNRLREAMDSTTHNGLHFTDIQKNKIRNAVHTDRPVKSSRPKPFVITILTAISICLAGFFISTELLVEHHNEKITGTQSTLQIWKEEHEYKENGKVIFSIFPDPELHAGKPYGYIFRFNEPFTTFKGRELSISAVHKETGQRIQALSPQNITEPSPGYSSLQRFSVSFQVPYSGLWRYEVYLDGKAYGDVVVNVDEKEESSVKFPKDLPDYVQESDVEKIDWNRKAAAFGRNFVGNENQTGIIGADMPSLTGQKWMWHLWGTDASELTVVGFHRETGTAHPVLHHGKGWTIDLGGEHNGADVHTPSAVTIPEKGEWAFLLYADREFFDVVVLEIDK
ncbi:hypothetical protein [Bacillus sp. Marseille-Q1617]|uniref:hypothetical protein n=1 Tax=Bacillus sp. Marseille-Q1617 TaxID=2736887 RepID=UPI00158EBDA1|nr:hypothetical protein [Bacillus sp. Marseille-Q1617]